MYSVISVGVFVSLLVVSSAVAPKSINLVLETSIRIKPQENLSNILDHVSQFMDKVKYALIPVNNNLNRRAQETKPKKYFTNILKETFYAIIKLSPMAINSFFVKLYEEIKYYFTYKGSAFADIIKNPSLRSYLVDTLKEWSKKNPLTIRRKIKEYMKTFKNKYTHNLEELLNNFYEQKDEDKMKKYVNKLKNCQEDKEFAEVIKAFLHNIIKQYDKMNYTARAKISDEVNRLVARTIQRRSQGNNKLNTIKIIDRATDISLGNISNLNTTTSLKNNTSQGLKRFKLIHPIENNIRTETNITEYQDITDNITSVSYNITNGTENIIIVPKAVDDGSYTAIVPLNITGTSSLTSVQPDKNGTNSSNDSQTVINGPYTNNVPKTIKNGTNESNVPETSKNRTKTINVPQIIKNGPNVTNYNYENKVQQAFKDWTNTNELPKSSLKASKASKHVNVPEISLSTKTTVSILHNSINYPEDRQLRTYDVLDKPEFLGKITPRLRKIRKRRKKGLRQGQVENKNNGTRVRKTTQYVPLWQKKQRARIAYERAHPMDIEDIVDMMHIDGK